MKKEITTPRFNVGDIVTISSDYKDFAILNLTQSQIQVYPVWAINNDGTITLADVWADVPAQYIEGVPIHSELARQIYYDTVHARHYEPGKVYLQEDIYSRPPFMVTMAERLRNTPLGEEMQNEEFHYVHELQHWLIEHIGYSRIRINQFWGMRKPIEA
jgi:hypothetical protein